MATKEREARIAKVKANRQKGLTLVLEDIHDPHNAAAAMRSAEAFGVEEVWVVYEKEKYANLRRVGRDSSASANKWLSIRFFRSTRAAYAALRRKGYAINATVLHEKRAKDLFSTSFARKKIAVVFGNEYRGLSSWAVAHADRLLTIPMRGFVESLNLSVSVGIFLFEATRQRLKKGRRA